MIVPPFHLDKKACLAGVGVSSLGWDRQERLVVDSTDAPLVIKMAWWASSSALLCLSVLACEIGMRVTVPIRIGGCGELMQVKGSA